MRCGMNPEDYRIRSRCKKRKWRWRESNLTRIAECSEFEEFLAILRAEPLDPLKHRRVPPNCPQLSRNRRCSRRASVLDRFNNFRVHRHVKDWTSSIDHPYRAYSSRHLTGFRRISGYWRTAPIRWLDYPLGREASPAYRARTPATQPRRRLAAACPWERGARRDGDRRHRHTDTSVHASTVS